MQVEKLDVENCEKLLQAILKKATFKVSGEEVLAANQLIMWAVKLKSRMQEDLKPVQAPIAPIGKKK
jgi:hypothetical protein